MSLATSSNDTNGAERKEASKNGTSSGKEKLSVFAFKDNDKKTRNIDPKKSSCEEKVKVDEKKNGKSSQEHKEEAEMETNGIEEKTTETNGKEEKQEEGKGMKKEEEEKMDTDDSVTLPPPKKTAKGEKNVLFISNQQVIFVRYSQHNCMCI